MRHTIRKLNIRLFAVLAAVLLMTPSALAAESGGCGADLDWTLDGGTLTISGTGDMADFSEPNMAPWYPYRGKIARLSLPEGLTSIGDLAFYDCRALKSVVLPDSVIRVGDYAFAECAGLTILDLGSGVQTVGEAAFSDCYALQALDLPAGLKTIGAKGFYRCESITILTIPGHVSSVGISAFGYCKRLVTAEILAPIAEIPEFMFYGCGNLVSVVLPWQISGVNDHAFRGCDQLGQIYYDGEAQTLEELRKTISQAVISNNAPGSVVSTGTTTTRRDDGTVTQEAITVVKGENTSVSTKVEHANRDDATVGQTVSAQIHVTVNGKNAWDEATDLMKQSLSDLKDYLEVTGESPEVNVSVYVKGTETVDKKFVEAVAGENVRLEVITSAGSGWKMGMAETQKRTMSGEYDLSYSLISAPREVMNALGTPHVVQVKFNSDAQIDAEVLIDLGQAWARQNAALFQRMGELTPCQTVVVDAAGCAHFYLGAVSSQVEYYIARELPATANMDVSAVIPAELHGEYGITDSAQKVEYVITGRKSDWGMDIGQVTWIMIGVMAGVVAVVGTTMYLLNKRRLKMGDIPEWDES